MRWSLGIAAALMVAAPAQGKYLHLVDAERAAARFGQREVRLYDGSASRVTRCWRESAHMVVCTVYVDDVWSAKFPFGVAGPPGRETVKTFVPVTYTHAGRVRAVSVFDARL